MAVGNLIGALEVAGGAASCIEENPGTGAADFESDMWSIVCASPPPGEPSTCGPPSVADIEAERAADGHDCTDEVVVTRAGALCIAAAAGLDTGIEGHYADLAYGTERHSPIWIVSNVLERAGQATTAAMSGEPLEISAVDGKVLGRSEWSAIA